MSIPSDTELKYTTSLYVINREAPGVRECSAIIRNFKIWDVVKSDHGFRTSEDRIHLSKFMSKLAGINVEVQYAGGVILRWDDNKLSIEDYPDSGCREALRLFNEAATDDNFQKATESLTELHSQMKALPEDIITAFVENRLSERHQPFKNWGLMSFDTYKAHESYMIYRLVLKQLSTGRFFDGYHVHEFDECGPVIEAPTHGGEVFPRLVQAVVYERPSS